MVESTSGLLIVLENPSRNFYPGQTIVGQVILKNENPKVLTNISIKFHGLAEGPATRRRFVVEEHYFAEQQILFGNDCDTITLPPGIRSYPFTFKLPIRLPPSIRSSFGNVKYWMEAAMKRPLFKLDVDYHLPFWILGTLDLNAQIGAKCPVAVRKSKSICCLWCRGGSVGFNLKLPRVGFVPGEFITFTANLCNFSRNIIRTKVSLIQKLSSKTNDGAWRKKKLVKQKTYGPNVPPGETEIWDGDVFKIPQLPDSGLVAIGRRYINIQYVLKLQMEFPFFMEKDISRKVPLIIGTKPLRNSQSSYSASHQDTNSSTDPHSSIIPGDQRSDNGVRLPFPSGLSVNLQIRATPTAPPSYNSSPVQNRRYNKGSLSSLPSYEEAIKLEKRANKTKPSDEK